MSLSDVHCSSKGVPTTTPQEIHVNQTISKMLNSQPALSVDLTSEKEEQMVEISDTF